MAGFRNHNTQRGELSKGKERESSVANPYPLPRANRPLRRLFARVPHMTFGIEMEFVLCIKKDKVEHQDHYEYFSWASSQLNHQPSLRQLVNNSYSGAQDISYRIWNLVPDISINARPIEAAVLYHVPVSEIYESYHCEGMELVSPVFAFEDIRDFVDCLLDVRAVLSQNAYNNETTGLHVHLGLPAEGNPHPMSSGLTLNLLKVLFLLWAASEPVIESLQPYFRRDRHCVYAKSLLTKINAERPDLATTAEKLRYMAYKLMECQDESEILINVIGDRDDFVVKKIRISPATNRKPKTVEFREHFGTISIPATIRWLGLCRQMLFFAHLNKNIVWTPEWLDNLFSQTTTLARLAALIQLGDGDHMYYHDQIRRVTGGEYSDIMPCI